jgi:hypothetical protein
VPQLDVGVEQLDECVVAAGLLIDAIFVFVVARVPAAPTPTTSKEMPAHPAV